METKTSGMGRGFPHRVKCRHDLEIEIQPLRPEDISYMRELHNSLDPSDRALLREDILNPFYDQRVKRQLEDDFFTRLVAWHDGRIIASLTTRRKRERWLQHTCELRAICNPKYRRYGIILALTEEAIPFVREKGIEKLYVNLMPAQKGAIQLLKNIGFQREATLKDHVKDEYGTYHDIRVYSMEIEAAYKAMDELFLNMMGHTG